MTLKKQSRRIATEIVVIGGGAAALFTAARLMEQGRDVTLVNPFQYFEPHDIRCRDGLSLWNAAYRASTLTVSLPQQWDLLVERMKVALPVSIEEAGLERLEHWSILSSTPIHQKSTIEAEQEFFRLERKSWTPGQVKLVNPEYVEMRYRSLGLRPSLVASIEGAMVRNYAVTWDHLRILRSLSEFVYRKSQNGDCRIFSGIDSLKRVGRRIEFSFDGNHMSLEYKSGLLVLLSGDLLPRVKDLVKPITEVWAKGLRRRRREQHFAYFERRSLFPGAPAAAKPESKIYFELGQNSYCWSYSKGVVNWSTVSGPDGLEAVVDEALRLESLPQREDRSWTVLSRNERNFNLEWDWKSPQWKQTSYDTFWGTSYEGDLLSLTELLWTMPLK